MKFVIPYLPLLSCVYFVLLLNKNDFADGAVDPLSWGFALGSGMMGAGLYAGWELVKCQYYECCKPPWVQVKADDLEDDLKERLHGQHLAKSIVLSSLRAHLRKTYPEKALVLSFHGWTGGGKNFIARIIAENLYQEGLKSQYVHMYMATLHFPHADRLQDYKEALGKWIKGNVTKCERSLFIFDEVDKMPLGLLDGIKHFIDYHDNIDGVVFRKSIFVFLSNTGGTNITMKALAKWKAGKDREEMTLKDFEEGVSLSAFNEDGGMYKSAIIEANLVDYFIPMLPLEKAHVKMCVKDELKSRGFKPSSEALDKIADSLMYFPADLKIYSKAGCKRVSQRVDVYIEELQHKIRKP